MSIHKILLIFSFAFISCLNSDQPKEASKVENSAEEQSIKPISLTTPDELYPALFKAVQLSQIFPDNKTFVDCTAKSSVQKINKAYQDAGALNNEALMSFVKDHFDLPISISSDFKSDPSRTAAEHVEALWPVLKREADTKTTGATLIPLPKPYIVPGGRFREVYYWDSYFTMLGLKKSGDYELMENILDNFAYLIETIGHIPNGNRVYYKTRSQPPFFAEMIKLTGGERNVEIYSKYSGVAEKEYEFWMRRSGDLKSSEHTVMTDYGLLNRYYDQGDSPRQESYREDFELVEKHNGDAKMYRDLRAGAESGWDYSSRWFSDAQNLHTIETTDIIPVDLNALLYNLEGLIIASSRDDLKKIQALSSSRHARKKFLTEKCFMPDGTFEDYNYVRGKTTGVKSLAMVYPLFFQMATKQQADGVAAYIEKHFLKPGGVVTTLNYTGQQWDAPNGWAPLQWMTIKGLQNYGHDALARKIAQRWVALNEKVYASTGKFVEKYNVEDLSLEAGEENIQYKMDLDGVMVFIWRSKVIWNKLLKLR